MSDNYITVAGFSEPIKAEIARGRLESEGIPAIVSGGLTTNNLFGNSNISGRVDLRVPAGDFARAAQILGECGDQSHLVDDPGDEGPVWLCPLCGEPVRAVLPVCPACHTPRGSTPDANADDDGDDKPEVRIQTPPASATRITRDPVETGVATAEAIEPALQSTDMEPEVEVPPLATMVGDAMARRAFYAALFGPAAAGLLSLYSMWLLLKLTFYRGELSAQGLRHMYMALGLNGAYMLLFCLLCGGGWGR
jgi:hypothetical protein